ncbi:pectate lyase [Marasmius fiardii PR-910]|nr:pectate lyase [Marasmius fiardii PR-910]
MLVVKILWLVAFSALVSGLQVSLNPNTVPVAHPDDWNVWTVTNGAATASTTISGVTLTLSAASGTTLKGAQNKIVHTKFTSYLGEHLVGQGMSTEATTGLALTLTIKGLSVGTHTLLSWHNAWDNLQVAAAVDVSVGSTKVVSAKAQTIRQDNIWTSASSFVTFNVTSTTQVITITYTPVKSSSITDIRAFLNGFEIDAAGPITSQASFPYPEHTNEHIDADSGSVKATWKGISGAKYDVYFSKSASTLTRVSQDQSDTSFTFTGISSLDTYFWRVDVISGSATTTGRTWTFRPRVLAFPGAEGYGKYARGGRGGKVVKVTTLADDGTGSLRWALTEQTGPRTIVFDVGGVITLNSRLAVNSDHITVAGQTAPGKGIVITNEPFGLSGASDVIIRHVRVRPGKASGDTVDGMGMAGSNHCIIDRCSVGWSIDESFSSRGAFNITLQRTMISEPLNVAGHKNYPPGTAHGYSASIGGDIGSFHHNLLAHAEGRSWSMAGGLDGNNVFAGRLDIRNNVVYNFGDRTTDGGAHQVNFVSNYYKTGPSSTRNYDLQATYEDNFGGNQTYFCSGNAMEGKFDQSAVQVVNGNDANPVAPCCAVVSFSPAPTYQKFFNNQFFEPFVETQTASEAYKRVLSDTGAQTPSLDDHDKRIVRETRDNKPTYKGSVTGKLGLIDSETDVGGLESFPTTTRPSNWDANNDGIADWWDGSNGGNAGWTALDGYLNFMGDPHFFVKPSATATYDLTYFAAGFAGATYSVSASKGSVSVSGQSLMYRAAASAGIDTVTVKITDNTGSTWTRTIGVAIFADA